MEDKRNGEDPKNEKALTTVESFGTVERRQVVETASAAAAAQAQAAVQARYVMAMQRTRDFERVRVGLMKDCRRPSFAAVARFQKPVGRQKNDKGQWEDKHVEGWSIRFAEAALRHWGNTLIDTSVMYDDATKRIVRATATDLETNTTYLKDVTILKQVERSNSKYRTVLSERVNTRGDKVYVVEATEDEMFNKESALISKSIRQNGLRLIPGDLLDECLDVVLKTLADADAADPDAAKRKIIDGFAALGVGPEQLEAYLGHKLDLIVPAELSNLRGIYTAIRDNEATWLEIMDRQGVAVTVHAEDRPLDKSATLITRLRNANEVLDALAAKIDAESFKAVVGCPKAELQTLEAKEQAIEKLRNPSQPKAAQSPTEVPPPGPPPKETAPPTNSGQQPGPSANKNPEAAQTKPADGDKTANPAPGAPQPEERNGEVSLGRLSNAAQAAGLKLHEVLTKEFPKKKPGELTPDERWIVLDAIRAVTESRGGAR
ncbi:MAG: hypothetical protein EPN91_00505 [Salinibacterium sp.]|nr:MAG: hypothetical protein EPN91_00505 [Salinibacterium sp.]